jgi:hypothetical protein
LPGFFLFGPDIIEPIPMLMPNSQTAGQVIRSAQALPLVIATTGHRDLLTDRPTLT